MTVAATTEPIRVVLADPHPLARMSVAHLLGWEDGIEVVSESASDDELLASVREHEPDVAVVDIGLWRARSGRLFEQLRQISPRIEVVVLTMHEEEWEGRLLAGAPAAHLLKDSPPAEMIAAVRGRAARRTGNGSGNGAIGR